jgi:hypothetical protein
MPLSQEVVAARIDVRVCELRLLAAKQFARHGSSGLARQPPPGAVRRPRRNAYPPGRLRPPGSRRV